MCIIGQNLYKSDAGAKRACKKAGGLSSWMMDAVKSATGVTRTRPVTRLLWGSAREHRTEGKTSYWPAGKGLMDLDGVGWE